LESPFLAVVHYEQGRKQRVEMNYLKSALVGVGAVFLIFVFVPLRVHILLQWEPQSRLHFAYPVAIEYLNNELNFFYLAKGWKG